MVDRRPTLFATLSVGDAQQQQQDGVVSLFPLACHRAYLIIVETFAVALATAILAFGGHSVQAISVPSFGAYILGIICILLVLWQVLGFFTVRSTGKIHGRYVTINILLTLAALIVAVALIAVSATRHSAAVAACQADFITGLTLIDTSTGTLTGSSGASNGSKTGKAICNIFTWAQLGVAGGLWLLLALIQSYFLMMQRFFVNDQRRDQAKYNSLRSQGALDDAFALKEGKWSQQPSTLHVDSESEFRQPYASRSRTEMSRQARYPPSDVYDNPFEDFGYGQRQQYAQQESDEYLAQPQHYRQDRYREQYREHY
ncbi:uncharacterized protein L969DRAFT_44217 [Mixia osmundae IAM 14324]|uniref:Uncharacterized protein n=1 Tax=Mixia osmundae (strain CBS 9802 / IAM 14324 / JCM 22182 / KY 12970) TaxID=764103 RepID=G7DZZ5_MIXOS|nr:uncharacterized protein L969DRAFT_44217 [Mixia osmundae IAM 14324]KEI42147.1 hypothetical protein L969DRAFT_44217 [Mixia osmundae IAM 14324]GAA96155.1 hypothetical protein E5Q_02816 [Mixia osmundae IAM 14324]